MIGDDAKPAPDKLRYTDDPVCPHCGHEERHWQEFVGGDEDGDHECNSCGRTYFFVTHRSTRFTTFEKKIT